MAYRIVAGCHVFADCFDGERDFDSGMFLLHALIPHRLYKLVLHPCCLWGMGGGGDFAISAENVCSLMKCAATQEAHYWGLVNHFLGSQ